jgi:hypothetical protein
VTPADRILKAAHMEIEHVRTLLDAMPMGGTHSVTIRLKPRGSAIRASVDIATSEREV